MKWKNSGRKQKKGKIPKIYKNLFLDETSQIYQSLKNSVEKNENFIANLGHSTFYIQINGKRILTDPFLYPFIFTVKRVIEPLRPDLLPKPDYILVSHAHYDHLDLRTLRHIDRDTTIIVQENTYKVVKRLGFNKVIELKHFDEFQDESIKVISLPVQHNKGRSFIYPNTETGSYYFQIDDLKLYFGGDTAYFDKFKEYGEKFDIDIAFLPIGGFKPSLLLRHLHMNPEEAVRAFQDLKANYVVPIHFGTFHTIKAFVHKERALERFTNELKKKNLLDKAIIIKPNELKELTVNYLKEKQIA